MCAFGISSRCTGATLDVVERQQVLVFVRLAAGILAARDLAENAVRVGSVQTAISRAAPLRAQPSRPTKRPAMPRGTRAAGRLIANRRPMPPSVRERGQRLRLDASVRKDSPGRELGAFARHVPRATPRAHAAAVGQPGIGPGWRRSAMPSASCRPIASSLSPRPNAALTSCATGRRASRQRLRPILCLPAIDRHGGDLLQHVGAASIGSRSRFRSRSLARSTATALGVTRRGRRCVAAHHAGHERDAAHARRVRRPTRRRRTRRPIERGIDFGTVRVRRDEHAGLVGGAAVRRPRNRRRRSPCL